VGTKEGFEMAAPNILAEPYANFSSALDKFFNLDPLVNSIQAAANAYQPATYVIAFVLLTAGTIREFLHPETRRFFGTLVHTIVLVACVHGAPAFFSWCNNAADALAQLPSGVSLSIGGTTYTLTGGQSPSLTAVEDALQSKVQGAGGNAGSGSTQSGAHQWGIGNLLGTAFNSVVGGAQHLAWQILFAIFLLWLLLCKVIIILMQFIQKIVVIGFNVYLPIAFGEYAHRSLRTKAVSFFLTYIGVLTWPVGWSLVNAVTLAILKSVPAPGNQNIVTLLIAIAAAVPVFLWVLIGYVVAPIYVQRVVARGGAAIQGFVGTMVSIVGGASASIFGAPFAIASQRLGASRPNGEGGEQSGWGAYGAGRHIKPEKVFTAPLSEGFGEGDDHAGNVLAPDPRSGSRRVWGQPGTEANSGARAVPKRIVAALDAGASAFRRFGSAAQFLGHGVAEGAGETSGLEWRGIRLVEHREGKNTWPREPRMNRSSVQARNYIVQG
jgi:hypothetical protein